MMACFGSCRRGTIEWWLIRTCMERILIALFVLLFVLIIVFGSMSSERSWLIKPTCNSSICLNEASKILRFRNQDMEPCTNFYVHTCGNFPKNAERKEKLSLIRFQTEQLLEFYNKDIEIEEHNVIKTAKRLFQSCYRQRERDLRQTDTLKSVLRQAGGWPVLEGGNWNENNFTWEQATYKFRELGYPYALFLDLAVEPDPADQNNYIYKTATADVNDYFYDLNEEQKIELMTDVALTFGAKDRENASREMAEAYEFWKVLLRNQYSVNSNMPFERIRLKYFQAHFEDKDIFNWITFNNKVSGRPYKLSRHHEQLFPPADHMINWIKLINGTSKRTQANYMMWKVIEETIPYMHCELRVAKGGMRKYERFEDFCLRETESRFVISPMRLIIDRLFLTGEKRKHLEELLSHFKSAFMELVENAKWIEDYEKEIFVDKIKNLDFVIGRPNNHYGDDILDQMMIDMMQLEENSFMSLIAQASKNFASMKYNQFRMQRSGSLLDKTYINRLTPAYIPEHNALYVPGAVFQLYFNEEKPKYLSYGEMGALLGYHIAEVIAPVINRTNWTGSTKTEFEKDIICLENEIEDCIDREKYPIPLCRSRSVVMAQQVIGEKISYSAYNKLRKKKGEEPYLIGTDYTQNQLFWLSAGAISCPRSIMDVLVLKKVFLAIVDNDDFNEAFNCPNSTVPKQC